jgi:hypothetical protein
MSWGEIYNTSWWGIALDTARTVKARPDFFGSQLNLLTSEQPNLVTNGSFDTDSDWILGGVGLNKAKIEDGVAKIISIDGNSYIQQSNILVVGEKYKINYTITNSSGDFVLKLASSFGLPSIPTSIGTHTLIADAISNTLYIERKFPNGMFASIDNVSVQLVRAELDQIEAKKCVADWTHTTALKDLNN